jgi:uncharacterized repeat protein (TIGR01451 family)
MNDLSGGLRLARSVASMPVGMPHLASRGAAATLRSNGQRWLPSLLLLACAALPWEAAQAQFATGGSGRFRNNIVWFSWGDHNTAIPQAGLTQTNSTTIDGQFLRVTCTLSNIAGSRADPDLRAYRPGNWMGDGLDDLYNIGGTGTSNTLVVGLANRNILSPPNSTTASGTLSCAATLGPNNNATDPLYPLQGLVFADAEQSGNSAANGFEFVEAQIAGTGTWRLIDRFRTAGCTSNGTATAQTGATDRLRFNGTQLLCGSGPMGVAFMEGVTTADFNFVGGGTSAIALGVMVFTADQGDAPASYGNALHLPGFTWAGGTPPESAAGTTTGYFDTFQLANLASPAVRLGATVDIEQVDVSNATATGDDLLGTPDDEDSVATIPDVALGAGGNYTLSGVTCGTAGTVYGYIDFNRDGDFADAGERSASATCAGGAVGNLVWTMPAAANLRAGASFLRLRIGTNDAQVNVPTGLSNDGEVEDHQITLNAPVVRVQKTTVGQAGGPFSFTATNLTGSIAAITTTAADTAQPAAPVGLPVTAMGTQVVLTETLPAGWNQQSATCTDANAAATGNTNPVATATTGPVTIPAAVTATAADITCVFRNAPRSTLQLTKAWAAGSIAGHQVTIGATTGGLNNTASFDATAPNAANSGAAVVVSVGDTIALPAETGANVADYTTTLACSGGHTLSGGDGQLANTLTITSTTAAVCTYTNALRTTDLSITKTNTPGNGPSDQAGDVVVAGAATTYRVVVTNSGANEVTGAVVRDTPQAGLNCPAGNAVTCTGTACPSGAITIGGLASGVTLGALAAGANVSFDFSCAVQ